MPYRLDLTEEANAELAALPPKFQRQIVHELRALANGPRLPQDTRLDIYRFRSGDYRVLYQVGDRVLLVLAVRIRHRQGVCRRLPPARPMDEALPSPPGQGDSGEPDERACDGA